MYHILVTICYDLIMNKKAKTQAKREDTLSFTVGFHFGNGHAYCSGFSLETVVSVKVGAKYRILVKHPKDGKFWKMKGMEEPMSQDEIHEVLKHHHHGALRAEEFVFEVFDRDGALLFHSKFNAQERIPPDGYAPDKIVWTSYSWAFELPERLKKEASKEAEGEE